MTIMQLHETPTGIVIKGCKHYNYGLSVITMGHELD